jgi:hypothetical protein
MCDGRSGQEWDCRCEPLRIKRSIAEEVEIDGTAVREMLRDRSPAVEDKFRRDTRQFVPQSALRRGKDFQVGAKAGGHVMMETTQNRCGVTHFAGTAGR